MEVKSATLEYDQWIEPYASSATVIGNICIVSLCFGATSSINEWIDLGIATVKDVKSAATVNTAIYKQTEGTCIDCFILEGTDRIMVNARGNNSPNGGSFRGILVYPIRK